MRSLKLPGCTSLVTVLHHDNATTLVDVTTLVAGLELAGPAHRPEFLDEFADLRRQLLPEKRPILPFETHGLGKVWTAVCGNSCCLTPIFTCHRCSPYGQGAKFYPLDVLREILGMMAVPVAVRPWGLIAEKLKAINWDAIATALRNERASTYNEELVTIEREIARLQVWTASLGNFGCLRLSVLA
jgi:hypothetical protein